jgi:DNA polymerase III sliding clamp (beta) subunit (PCNA family)
MEKKVLVVHDEKGKAVSTVVTNAEAKAEDKKPDLKVVPKTAAQDKKDKKPVQAKPVSITFKRKTFQQDVGIAGDFIAKKDGVPVLTHILIDSDGKGHCRIMSTDLEVAWSKVITCKGPKLSKCVPGALLLKEIKALPEDIFDVVLEFSGNTVSVNGRCKLFTLSGDDFPVRPEIKKWTGLYIDNFIKGLKAVSQAMSQGDDNRYTLQGAYLDLTHNRVVATDGHRLHMENIRVRGEKADSLIIPRKAVALIIKYPLTEVPKLTREKGKTKIGESLDKPSNFELDVFGHKVKVKYAPQVYKGTIYNAQVELNGPVNDSGYLSDYVPVETLKKSISEYGSLKNFMQAMAEDKYLSFNKTVFITVSEKHMTYPIAEGEMLIKTIEGNFPKYTDIIPKDNPIKVRFSSSDFLQNMNGVLPLNNDSVVLKINSHLTIQTQSPDRGTYQWQIPCKTEGKDKGVVNISFNAKYIVEAIKAYSSQEVTLEIKEPTDKIHYPAIVNKKAVIMPMRA